jgi:hypothetical protein
MAKNAIVCVWQLGVQLLAPGQGVPGRVLDTRFLGNVGLVEVAVQGLDAPIPARVRESDVPRQGVEVSVGVDAGAVLVFEADSGAQGRQPPFRARLEGGGLCCHSAPKFNARAS